LENKNISLSLNTLSGTLAQFNIALTDANFTSLLGAETLQNKTINANNNTISNLDTANFESGVIDTDGALTANSNTRLATQKAVKTYVDSQNGFSWRYIDADYTPTATDSLLLVDTYSADITITLPPGGRGKPLTILKYNTASILSPYKVKIVAATDVTINYIGRFPTKTSGQLQLITDGDYVQMVTTPELNVPQPYYTGESNIQAPSREYYVSVYANAFQTNVASGTVVAFNAAITNPNSYWNTGTYRYTAPVSGKYLITGSLHAQAHTVGGGVSSNINVYNASNTLIGGARLGAFYFLAGIAYQSFVISYVATLAATDYFNISVRSLGNINIAGNTSTNDAFTHLQVSYLGP
jgi:hypothetical protein